MSVMFVEFTRRPVDPSCWSVTDASESGTPRENSGGRLQRELGGDFKVPLPMFSGRNENWPKWTARFEGYAESAGWLGIVDVAAA